MWTEKIQIFEKFYKSNFSNQSLAIDDLQDFYLQWIIGFQRADNPTWPKMTSTVIFELLIRLYQSFWSSETFIENKLSNLSVKKGHLRSKFDRKIPFS